VLTETRGCVFFFCRKITLTQDVTIIGGVIRADIVPEKSDFRSGYLRWSVTPTETNGSHIEFDAIVEPDSFLPPLIGKFFIFKNLRQQILLTAENLEKEAARQQQTITHID